MHNPIWRQCNDGSLNNERQFHGCYRTMLLAWHIGYGLQGDPALAFLRESLSTRITFQTPTPHSSTAIVRERSFRCRRARRKFRNRQLNERPPHWVVYETGGHRVSLHCALRGLPSAMATQLGISGRSRAPFWGAALRETETNKSTFFLLFSCKATRVFPVVLWSSWIVYVRRDQIALQGHVARLRNFRCSWSLGRDPPGIASMRV